MVGGFILGSLSFFGIGFILAGIMPTARTAQVVAMVLLYPMLIFSGAAWPRELMPAAVQKVSTFLPLTYVVNLLRGLWTGAALGRSPAGCRRAGRDARGGDYRLGEDIPLGVEDPTFLAGQRFLRFCDCAPQ